MSISPVTHILRSAYVPDDGPFNIVTCPTHERFETNLCKTGHNFWAMRHKTVKDWNDKYAKVPENYVLLNPEEENNQIPLWVDVDIVLSQNKFGQYQILYNVARQLGVPLISLEHTLPVPGWPSHVLENTKQMRGHLNVFISRFSVSQWGFSLSDPTVRVIEHGVDTDLFTPGNRKREGVILSVVNDWINRDVFCGYSIWKKVSSGLPTRIIGDTPGLSQPAASLEELIEAYQSSRIFLNTSTWSPVPMSLLEAMACGCACVSTDNCGISEYIQHGVNGLLSNNESELRYYLQQLLENPDLADELGRNARKTIVEKYNLDKFVTRWKLLFNEAFNMRVHLHE